MAIIQKINPVALDVEIDRFQSYVFNKVGFASWECFHRIYANPKGKGDVPEAYLNGGDYKEVFFNDKFSITSFFIEADERTNEIDEGIITVEVSLIVQAILTELYPGITHRADEELKNAFINASMDYQGYESFSLQSIVTGVDKVYQEFNQEELRLDDMSSHNVVRFNYAVRYDASCN